MAKLTKEQMIERLNEFQIEFPINKTLARKRLHRKITICLQQPNARDFDAIMHSVEIERIMVEHNCTEGEAEQIKKYGEIRW